jgi:hypothetical protein
MKKKIINVLKAPNQWGEGVIPSGIGDFVIGCINLYELALAENWDIKIDISQTPLADLIIQNQEIFQTSLADEVVNAPVFKNPKKENILEAIKSSFEIQGLENFYLHTNYGFKRRNNLPAALKEWGKKFYCFNDEVSRMAEKITGSGDYSVLVIRCGDYFFQKESSNLVDEKNAPRHIINMIERYLPELHGKKVFIMCDFDDLKIFLSNKYNFSVMPHKASHGASGSMQSVAIDLAILKNSQQNIHINAWAPWWSGFSHYTSLIHSIPTINIYSEKSNYKYLESIDGYTKTSLGSNGEVEITNLRLI